MGKIVKDDFQFGDFRGYGICEQQNGGQNSINSWSTDHQKSRATPNPTFDAAVARPQRRRETQSSYFGQFDQYEFKLSGANTKMDGLSMEAHSPTQVKQPEVRYHQPASSPPRTSAEPDMGYYRVPVCSSLPSIVRGNPQERKLKDRQMMRTYRRNFIEAYERGQIDLNDWIIPK